ncbi:MAG: SDR family NAD(P)-dependent oxidoreductase [Bacteroidales bacterium]
MMEKFNPFSLKGKVILVTGASSGIGKSIAIECSKMEAILIIVGRDELRLNETYSQLFGEGHQQYLVDLTNDDDCLTLVSQLPILDGIVHCAGVLKKLPFKFLNRAELNRIMDLNFYSPTLLSQAIVRQKKLNQSASVVFISSIASHVASYGSSAYMASKGAINSIYRGMALELSEKRIRVNCVEPGLVKTQLTIGSLTDEDLENYEKRYPLGRFGEPEEIAYAVIYLLSDATKWITGSVLTIDGGITLR